MNLSKVLSTLNRAADLMWKALDQVIDEASNVMDGDAVETTTVEETAQNPNGRDTTRTVKTTVRRVKD